MSRVGASKVKSPWPVPLAMPQLAAHWMGAAYQAPSSTSWKRLPGYCAGSMPSQLARAVTNIPRVIGASGSKVVALVPESTPDPAAHCTWG